MFGLRDVVADLDDDLLSEDAARRIDVVGGLTDAILHLGAGGGARSGDRAGNAELDLRLGSAGAMSGSGPMRQP